MGISSSVRMRDGSRGGRGFRRSALLLPFLAGCLAAPQPASRIVPDASKVTRASLAPDPAALPAGYWSRAGDFDPAAALEKGRRVAITGFAVEMIDVQYQIPGQRQLAFKPPPIATSATGALFLLPVAAIEIVGIGRRSTPLAEADQLALTGRLYEAFEADLRDRGLDVVSRDAVIASPANVGRPKPTRTKSPLLMLLNPMGSDTGQVLHSTTVNEPGLGRGAGRRDGLSETDLRILDETGADLALDVHLRVGTYYHKAALEHRSVIRMTTRQGLTTLQARRSLLSDADVSTSSRFVPIKGRVSPVEPASFGRELATILPKFVELTLVPPPR